MKKTLLIVNLGTPDKPNYFSVFKYLRQFLMDGRVINVNSIIRFFLVNLIIVPFRTFSSSKIYRQVWDKETGSPLLYNTKKLAEKLNSKLPDYDVEFAMRYQNPSLEKVINKILLKNPEGIFDVIIKNKIIGIIDYAHTPDALLNVLETIVKIKQNENSIITVVGCGGGRDRAKRLKMGSIASRLSQKVIFTSDNPRDEDPKSIIDDMIAGVDDADKSKILNIVDRKEAIVKASKVAKPNDILLVAGKGHEKYQIIKSKKIRFNDKEILTQTLKMAV